MAVYVARQPILDLEQRTAGYELLFRSGPENVFPGGDGDRASLAVMGSSICQFGLDQLTEGTPAYINFTHDLLLKGFPTLFPPDRIVIEILEGAPPDVELITACTQLRKDGYRFALDDLRRLETFQPFAGLVDIVKVDFLRTTPEQQREIADQLLPRRVVMLAEKVEEHEEVERARACGYTLFQGFFFSKPMVLSSRRAPSRKTTDMLLLQEAFRPEISLDRIELIIKQDPGFSLKLLRYVNSAFFGLRTRIHSIRQALIMIGEKKLRKWVTVLVATGFSEKKPALLTQAVVRASFCERVASLFGLPDEAQEIFMTGLLSLLDAIMDQTCEEILSTISVADRIEAAIRGEESPYGDILALVKAYEQGDWNAVSRIRQEHCIAEEHLPPLYEEAVQWTRALVRIAGGQPAPAGVSA